MRPASKFPTESELEILNIIWEKGPATVREVRNELAENRALAYTTVMTMMSIMSDKGYLRRVRQGTRYVYEPKITRNWARRRMLGDLVERLFNGSTGAAAVHLLESGKLSESELDQVRRLLESQEGS